MNEIDLNEILVSEMTGSEFIGVLVGAGVGLILFSTVVIAVLWVYKQQLEVLWNFYDKFGLKQSFYLLSLMIGLMIIVCGICLIWQTPLTLLIAVLYSLLPLFVPLMIFVLIKGKPVTEGVSKHDV